MVIYTEQDKYLDRAERLADELGARITRDRSDAEAQGVFLQIDEEGIALAGGGLTLRADLTGMLPRIRTSNLRGELLVRAAKIRGAMQNAAGEQRVLRAVDATAGFGEDSLLLAAAGFSVRLYEYNPVTAILLEDALQRASQVPELSDIVSRMELVKEDSVKAMPQLGQLGIVPDVILLDPMFPARQKSGLIRKKLQLIQKLEKPCADEEALVKAALAAHPKKIVIKRPAKGPYLAGIRPGYSIEGKVIRYDCIVPPSQPM
jgi:16S rRNA (guanine1516-N2)-methyltransferase